MAEHVSFIASDELAEWLREEADRRALTVEATVQELLAASYRGRREEADGEGVDTDSDADSGGPDAGGVTDDDDLAALADEVASQPAGTDALDNHPDAWTVERRGGERYYVITRGERSVHSSRAGAAEVLERRVGE